MGISTSPSNDRRSYIWAAPRRNIRDPRLKSYRPSSPVQFKGQPINIPLEYEPVLEAKIPVRKLGPERSTKVYIIDYKMLNYLSLYNNQLIKSQASREAPNMKRIMDEMTAIHGPTVPTKKPNLGSARPLLGTLVKGVKPPKGSVNVPGKRKIPLPHLLLRVKNLGRGQRPIKPKFSL